MTLRPASAPTPVLKYQLLPELKDQTPGNAALLYYRGFAPDWLGNARQPRVMERVADSILVVAVRAVRPLDRERFDEIRRCRILSPHPPPLLTLLSSRPGRRFARSLAPELVGGHFF